MKIYVKVGQKVVGRGNTIQSSLKFVSKLFRQGETDIYISGGRIGSWRQ